MPHSFAITVHGDITMVLRKVEEAITGAGGMFRGDQERGSFTGESFLGMISGDYQVNPGNEIRITITEKPLFIPYSIIESEVRKYFG